MGKKRGTLLSREEKQQENPQKTHEIKEERDMW